MESRFTHLRQRDTSVSMLRVKMSRRRSQSQKENRERAVNTRRHLDKLPEMDVSSLDASIAVANMSTMKIHNNTIAAKNKAVEERLKQLDRWKERKALEKEKEKREKERKGVFKTGLYRPADTQSIVALPPVPGAPAKESGRVTRSMKQQQKPLKTLSVNTAAKMAPPPRERPARRKQVVSAKPAPTLTRSKVSAVEPAARAPSTRSVNRPPVTAVPVVKDKPKDKSADVRTTRSRANAGAPPSGRGGKCAAAMKNAPPDVKEAAEEEEEPQALGPCSEEEVNEGLPMEPAPAASGPAVEPDQEPSILPSFAPQGFVFQAPSGLSSFKFEPLTPRSADAFLTPSSSFSLPSSLVFNMEPQAEFGEPTPPKSPPRSSPTAAAPAPVSPSQTEHNVPYFRSEIASETKRLTSLCTHWEAKVENESIPEEMRDRMRTAVGQARLLMKERFKQFSGLVDDCELCRGEKITTCSDLQGFWDMVYYQVEDVNKKFDALKEAEARNWVEHRPPPRQRKVVKKPTTAPAKPAGAKAAAAKSRLAAVKAAMKAKQQAAEAEKAAKDAGEEPSVTCEEPSTQSEAQQTSAVVFDGGFIQVESPARASGSVRRSTRLAAVAQQPDSPCSDHLSPRRVTRRSLALAQTPHLPSPAHFQLTLSQTPARTPKTPRASQRGKDAINSSLCFSPVTKGHDGTPAHQTDGGSMQEVAALPSSQASPTTLHPLPTISVEQEDGEPAEAVAMDPQLATRRSLSPCKSLPFAPQPTEPSSALSFTLSPCRTPHQPPLSSPATICSSPAVQSPMETKNALCLTPDNSVVEEIPGLDFERYLQPTQGCSLSPNSTVAEETLSPMAVDVEMESPRGQTEGPTQQEPALPSMLCNQSLQAQTAESTLLLFTPNTNDRIRQSVCPKDLMVFTPPL